MLSGAVSAQTTTTRELTNLVIFIRFADDEEITHPFADIDTMFNGRTPGYYSVYNFYDALSYGRIHYNTVYTNNIQNGTIVSYRDTMPRGYFQPYSETNPIGYHGQNPLVGISMREAQLQARAFRYVDSLGLVSPDVVLDGDGDGDIDNVSFIVKGGIGEWASILWPHMEYFPHDSIDHPVTVNGVRPPSTSSSKVHRTITSRPVSSVTKWGTRSTCPTSIIMSITPLFHRQARGT